MKWIVYTCMLLSMGTPGLAQILSTGDDILFAFEVKQIDEFIERFNNEKTLIKEYIHKTDSRAIISRSDMLKALINKHDTTWNIPMLHEFINTVNNKENPVFLNFLDPEWYAEIICSVKYMNSEQKITLILKIERGVNQGSKWVIVKAIADFLKLPVKTNASVFLNPISHGTDFLGLDKALEDKTNIRNFLPSGYQEDQLSIFLDHWKNGKITLNKVDKITYHFLQVEGWVFQVENFPRKSRNQGWLISKITKVDDAAKNKYKNEILQLN